VTAPTRLWQLGRFRASSGHLAFHPPALTSQPAFSEICLLIFEDAREHAFARRNGAGASPAATQAAENGREGSIGILAPH
jgi:hypothetical protein